MGDGRVPGVRLRKGSTDNAIKMTPARRRITREFIHGVVRMMTSLGGSRWVMAKRIKKSHPALKHGAFAQTTVLYGEDPKEFEKLHLI